MGGRNFFSNNKLVIAKVATVAGTSAINSDVIDTAGFRGVVFLTTLAVNAAGNNIKVQQDTDSGGGTMADIAGGLVASGTGGTVMSMACSVEPTKRYVRCVVTRGTSSACAEIWAILFGADLGPINSDATTLTTEQHVRKAEGTA